MNKEHNLQYVGQRLIREDSYDRATGDTRYVGDMKRAGMLYARLFLSDHAHADYTLDLTEARAVPGIVAIYTHADVPNKPYNAMEWFSGIKGHHDEYLLNPRALYDGDRLALVVGESKAAVEEALSLIRVTYTDRPLVLGVENAMKDEVILKNDSNLCYETTKGYGSFEEQARDALVIQTRGRTPKIHHGAIEPHVCLTEFDEQGSLLVWTPCQVAFQVRMHVAEVNDLPYARVRVIKAPMGGSFGGKSQPLLEPICAFATLQTKRPVLLYMDRADVVKGTWQGNAMEIDVKLAVSPEGFILGRHFEVDIDGGAYNTNSAAVANAFAKKIFRLYRMPSQTFHGRAYYTNTTPSGACRAYGSPQAHAVAEVNIDQAANALNLDPVDFRLKNLVHPGDLDPSGGTPLGNVQIIRCVEDGRRAFDWDQRRRTVKQRNDDRFRWGVGMACASHVNGYTGAFPDFTNVQCDLEADGNITIKISIHEQGCGTVTTMKQIAAETLSVPPEQIHLGEADTARSPYDAAGTQASRVTYSVGASLKYACDLMKQRIVEAAAAVWGGTSADYILCQGELTVSQTGEMKTLRELAVLYERDHHNTVSILAHHESKTNPASTAAFFCEVCVDTYTGLFEITDALAVHDIGRSINPTLVEGQIQGGAHFSIGGVVAEGVVHDAKGRVQNLNFSKYRLMNAMDMPEVKVLTVEAGGDDGPYGAKSVGEISAIAPAPAIMNALNFALDTKMAHFPALPEHIIQVLKQQRDDASQGGTHGSHPVTRK